MAKNADLSQYDGNLILKNWESNTRSQMAYILAAKQLLVISELTLVQI